MDRQVTRAPRRARRGLALVPLALVLAGCGSGGGGGSGGEAAGTTSQSDDATLVSAGTTVQSALSFYVAAVGGCAKQASPVVCLESADHTLGDKIHNYANVLAGHHQFSAPKADLNTTLNAAQTLANSLEILGDAQPTQANYDQVLNTFDITSAISQLQADVTTLSGSLSK